MLLLACQWCAAEPSQGVSIRVLSWNISGDAFEREPEAFDALMAWAKPDILLFDEVTPGADLDALRRSLERLAPGRDWQIHRGPSGGRERGLVATHFDVDAVAEFASEIPYSAEDREAILAAMGERERTHPRFSLEHGLPAAARIVLTPDGRLLVVATDFACCGDSPESGPEVRRRIEARLLRERIRTVLQRANVDGVIVAGDFNLVESTFGMSIITGPYPPPIAGLIPAELYHPDGSSTWTWDGRGMPFPSDVLDYQLYSPAQLAMESGLVLDAESLSQTELDTLGIASDFLLETGRHRPLLVVYALH